MVLRLLFLVPLNIKEGFLDFRYPGSLSGVWSRMRKSPLIYQGSFNKIPRCPNGKTTQGDGATGETECYWEQCPIGYHR